MAGYSTTPLIHKLGIKPGMRLRVVQPPGDYEAMIGRWPANVRVAKTTRGMFDFIHCFVTNEQALRKHFPALKKNLADTGILWISWPKGGSAVKSSLKEGQVRVVGLECGLVDVKICAVDDDWSALKFVYRLKDRKH